MHVNLSTVEPMSHQSTANADLTSFAPARKECLSEFSVVALIAAALGLSGLLWAAIFSVI